MSLPKTPWSPFAVENREHVSHTSSGTTSSSTSTAATRASSASSLSEESLTESAPSPSPPPTPRLCPVLPVPDPGEKIEEFQLPPPIDAAGTSEQDTSRPRASLFTALLNLSLEREDLGSELELPPPIDNVAFSTAEPLRRCVMFSSRTTTHGLRSHLPPTPHLHPSTIPTSQLSELGFGMLPSAIDGEELRIPPTPRLRPRKAKVMQEFYPLPPPLASAETETEMEEEMGERVVPVPVRRGGCRKRRVGLGELAW